MTNSEAIKQLIYVRRNLDEYLDEDRIDAVDDAIFALEENTKLKAEIERIKNESHRRSSMLLKEIKKLESELEQSVRLPLTNADKIRSMSDKELAEFLTRITNDAQLNVGAKCNYQWDEWLQNEVENGD